MLDTRPRLDPDVREAYLARLGVDAAPPSADGLRLLAQRHAERVPYETLWIHAGEGWGIDPHESAARIALAGRGGYCYHLNGALGLLLASLGYDVRAHVGGVEVGATPDPAARGNHLALTVALSPSAAWFVAFYLTTMGTIYRDSLTRQGHGKAVEAVLAANAPKFAGAVPSDAEDLLEQLIVFGTPSEARRRLARWHAAGASMPVLLLRPNLAPAEIKRTLEAFGPMLETA